VLHHAPHQATAVAAADRLERAIVRVVNRSRAVLGLPRLRMSHRLNRVAGAHSRDLIVHHQLSHTGSNGTPFARRLHRVTAARVVGETIAEVAGAPARADAVVMAWLASPPHRAELLSRSFRRVGVGRARRGGATVITADFASAR
jgi:uncharacterized protein YkwD